MEPFTMFLLYAGYQLFKALADNWDSVVETTVLAWQTVTEWFTARRISAGDVGNLIAEQLAGGSYRVVGGVFSNAGVKRESVAWECSGMDPALRQRLDSQNKLTINL
jgi:hypothetical protein